MRDPRDFGDVALHTRHQLTHVTLLPVVRGSLLGHAEEGCPRSRPIDLLTAALDGREHVAMLEVLRERLRVTRRAAILYVALYLPLGFAMNALGEALEIAEFAHEWQVLTCYLGYLVPVSLWLRARSAADQYAWGMVALAPLELLGHALGTSLAHDGNVLDRIFGERNFVLLMVIAFGSLPLLGNRAVAALDRRLPGGPPSPST